MIESVFDWNIVDTVLMFYFLPSKPFYNQTISKVYFYEPKWDI